MGLNLTPSLNKAASVLPTTIPTFNVVPSSLSTLPPIQWDPSALQKALSIPAVLTTSATISDPNTFTMQFSSDPQQTNFTIQQVCITKRNKIVIILDMFLI